MTEPAPLYRTIYDLTNLSDHDKRIFELENRIAGVRVQITTLQAYYTELCGKLQQELIKAE